ncbi:MAG: hypothetical protein ACI9U2_004123, partial [Bradymonadia bacterium]
GLREGLNRAPFKAWQYLAHMSCPPRIKHSRTRLDRAVIRARG